MRTGNTKILFVPIAAMLVAFAWSMLTGGPVQPGNPYPLPANYAAVASADVEAD